MQVPETDTVRAANDQNHEIAIMTAGFGGKSLSGLRRNMTLDKLCTNLFDPRALKTGQECGVDTVGSGSCRNGSESLGSTIGRPFSDESRAYLLYEVGTVNSNHHYRH